jgi:hypothetical protein
MLRHTHAPKNAGCYSEASPFQIIFTSNPCEPVELVTRLFQQTHMQNKTKCRRGSRDPGFLEAIQRYTHERLLDSFSDRGSSFVAKPCRLYQRPPLEGHLVKDRSEHVLLLSMVLANGAQPKSQQRDGFLTAGVLLISLHQQHLSSTGCGEA